MVVQREFSSSPYVCVVTSAYVDESNYCLTYMEDTNLDALSLG